MTHLNLSSLKVLLNVGESPRPDTPTKIRKCFVPYGMPRTCKIMVGYGLAEHVLALSWMPQDTVVVPSCYNFALTKRVAVATVAGLEAESITLAVVDPKTKKRVAKMFERRDADGDGSLTLEESQGRRDPARFFARMDADNSGGISEEEFTDARKKMRKHRRNKSSDN